MKIAFFIYDRGLQVHHYNLVKGFAERGEDVHLFMHDADEFLFKLRNFKMLRVHLYSYYDFLSLRKRILRKLFNLYCNLFEISEDVDNNIIISVNTLKKSKEIVEAVGKFDYAVGFEKKGLIWAGRIFEKSDTRLIYYSLELYEDGHYFFINDKSFPIVREHEKYFHKKCDATIVQDPERRKFLYMINEISDQKAIYLPVSVSKEIPILKPGYLHSRTNKKLGKIILCFGRIDDHRRCTDVAKGFAIHNNPGFSLVFNGDGDMNYVRNLTNYSDKILHFKKSSDRYVDSIIADAYIGLVTYEYLSINEKLTVFASEKLAYYLKHRRPVIAFSNDQYDKFFEDYMCGIAIKDKNDIWQAIMTIHNDYSSFQNEAYRAYQEYYCFENRFDRVYDDIKSLAL